MSLVDPKETRIAVSSEWNPTIEEIEQFFEKRGYVKVIDELLKTKEMQDYFQFRLVENFFSYTRPKVKFDGQTKGDIKWLLNQDALKRDVKVNVEIWLLKKSTDVGKLNEFEMQNVIYELEETIDDVFRQNGKKAILWHRTQEKKENQAMRRRIVLIEQ